MSYMKYIDSPFAVFMGYCFKKAYKIFSNHNFIALHLYSELCTLGLLIQKNVVFLQCKKQTIPL